MAFSYEQIEDEVVTRLGAVLSSFAVTIPLPDTQKEVDDSIKAAESENKALVIVIYDSSAFDSTNSTNQTSQKDNIDIVCNIRSSKRRGNSGVMKMIYLVKTSLQGYKVANANRLFLKEIKLEDHDIENKIFSYNVTFTCSKMQVQAFLDGDDDTTLAATLNKINWPDKSFNGQTV